MHHSPTDKSQGAPTAPAPAREPCEVAPPSSPVWAAAARVLPALLFIFALATRLWGIGKPAGIVFDELHFGKFVQWTLKRWYYFDIHPPLAKQTLAVLSILWGYDPDKCDYEPPAGQPRTYAPDCEYWKLRCIVAAFSAAACVLMFFVARRLGATVAGACLAALLEVFSVMHNVEGRLILLNSQLIFWLNASLLAGLAWFARANRAPRMALGERLRWAAGVGAFCGNAVCIKHTGLATPGLLGVEAALGLFFLRQPLPLLDLLTFVASMAATYTLWFAIHIGTMIHSHATLRQEQEFMSPQYQSLLLGSPTYDPNAKWTEGFWWTFVTLNRRMVVHSAAITQPHAWGTRPWEWIFALRGVSYWGTTMGGGADDHAAVYLLPNAVVNWMVAAVVLGAFPLAFFLLSRTAWVAVGRVPEVDFLRGGVTTHTPFPLSALTFWRGLAPPIGAGVARALALGGAGAPAPALDWGAFVAPMLFCGAGFLLNLAPYAAIVRTCFAYHYMPALVYGHLALALAVDRVVGAVGDAVVGAAAALFWVFMLPWIYGWPLTEGGHAARRWLPRWN